MDDELKYPNQITNFTSKKNAKYDGDPEGDYVLAEHVNELQEAINRLEKALGVHVPKSSSLTERIESLEGLEPMRVPSVGYFPFGLEGELTSVLSILSSYDLLLLGEGSNVESVINQTKVPTYGIVDATIDLSILQNQIAVWKTYGIKGVFLDNFEGFNTRAEEQEVVDSVAQEGLHIVFSSTDIDRKLNNQVLEGYNPLAEPLKFPKETIYILKDFGYQSGFPAQDILLDTVLPLINSLKDKNLKIMGFSSADDAEKFHYTQALSLLFSLDYLYNGNSLGETIETRTPLFDWPTSLSNWRTNELRVFSDNSSIYRHIKNGVVRVYKDGTFELSGLEIPSDMIQWYENIIPGFAIKEGSIDPGKLSTYDILKIIDLINNAPDEYRIDGTKIRTDGGGGFLPINIPASNMIQNVVEAINRKNNPATQETWLIEDYAIKSLDAEKITGNIRKEQLVNQVVQAINEASNEDVYINVPRVQVVDINSTGTSELNTVTGDNLTFRAGNITESLTVRDIQNTNFIEGNDGEFYKLYIQNLTVDTLSGLKDLHVENLTADNIGSLVLEAVEAQIETGVFNQIITHALTAENIQADLVTALNAVVDKQITNTGLFGDAVIKSAAIDTVSASKINSGVINTTLVDLASEDGHLRIEDNKLTIYDDLDSDGNRRLRVLLGNTEDVSGTFGLVVLGEDGETRLYDHTGVYNAGLHNNIISNEKIQDEAIDGRVIKAETIIGEHILGRTITGDLIAGDTITAFNILAETITAKELATDAIRARHILAGEIESGHISSGSIETKHIQAGAITAEQLAIGFNINLMKDGMDSFEQEELGVFRGFAFVGNSKGEVRNDWSYDGENSLVISGNSTQNTVLLGSSNNKYALSVRPGREYFVSAFARNEVGGRTPVRIGFAYGTNTTTDSTSQLSNVLEVEQIVSRIWTKLTIPEDIQRAAVILSVDATNTEVWFDSIQVEEAEENQTAPGPWKTTATTRINADQIQTGRIGADFIQLGTGAVFGDNTIVEINDEGIKAKSKDGFAMLNNKGLEIEGGAFQLRSGTLGEKSFRIENSTLTAETPLNLIQIDPDKGFQIVSKQNNQILFDTDPDTGEIRMSGTFKVYSKDNPEMAWTVEDKFSEIEREIENIELTPGPDGLTAYQVAVSEGFEGTQNEWINSLVGEVGPSGKTPYELALEEGFKGTQEDWLNSLVGKDGEDSYSSSLSNDNHTINTNSDGENGLYEGAESTLTIYKGNKNDTHNWTVSVEEGPGISGEFDTETKTYKLRNINLDASRVIFKASKEGQEDIIKVFTLNRLKAAKKGQDAITYLLNLDTFYLRKDREEETITPSEFSVKGLKSVGGSAPGVDEGYFVVYEQLEDSITIDNYTDMVYKSLVELEKEYIISGVDFPYVKRYQSMSPESEIVLTPSTNILKLHIEWYEDEGLTILRDVEQIPVVSDGLDTYRVEIKSLNGDTFKNGIIDTWLYATVYKGDKDVTSEIEERRFEWTRMSIDEEQDKLWNDRYYGGRKEIKITHEDVYKRATFNCSIRKQ